MSEQKVPYTIYAEMTPNPQAMKFVANKALIEHGVTVEFNSEAECQDAPLAAMLFSFPFVEKVFFSNNFVSVNATNGVDWNDFVLEFREYLTNYLQAGQPIFTKPISQTQHEKMPEEGKEETEPQFLKVLSTPSNEDEESIVNILEEYVRPAVESDGGAIHFKSYKDGVLTVKLSGACSGCPSSNQTLKVGIQNLFNKFMPEVKEVVAENQD